MSKTVENALSGLREFGLKKIEELDKIFEENQVWLASVVEDAKRQLVEAGPAIKKRRLTSNDVGITHQSQASKPVQSLLCEVVGHGNLTVAYILSSCSLDFFAEYCSA